MTFVSDLEPKELWRHFDHILTIPRGSKNEAGMVAYVIETAKRKGLSYKQDGTGNVVVSKPATQGYENAPITILQSHLDMVCEKNADVDHDFEVDAIKPRQEGDYLYASGTTLGADNGIGVASELALFGNDSAPHGPLEFLFTVDEETGLTGAANLSSDFLRGRQLINLDSEEEGALYFGCAGGLGVNLALPLRFVSRANSTEVFNLKLFGLHGGHSGMDIHLQRGNAIKLLARALNAVRAEVDFDLARISGGNMHNAIPREAFATISVNSRRAQAFTAAMNAEMTEMQSELETVEPDLQFKLTSGEGRTDMLDRTSTRTVLNLLDALPHGVISMNNDMPELVETSANLAIVKTDDEELHIHSSNRSSSGFAIGALTQRIRSIAELAGAEVTKTQGYPGWKPNLDSEMLKVAQQAYQDQFGKEAKVKAIHAGLECGIIGEKYPGMDMVSIGPQIEYPHSPGERVRIGSVADFYRLLNNFLERLARQDS